MAGIMDFVKGNLGPIGVGANIVGGVLKTVGAIGQAREAKRQVGERKALAGRQKIDFNKTYGDLLSLANNQAVYKGDTSLYGKAESEAKKQQMMSSINPADQLMREQSRQSTANYIENASRGAKSGTDLMSIAGIGNAQESQSMNNININSANQAMSMKDRANQNMINALSQTAAASARERGLEFESLLNKQQGILGLTREKGLGGLEMDYRNAQEDFASRAAYQNAKSSIFSSVGDIFGAVGGNLGQMSMMDKQMSMFKDMNSFSGSTPSSEGRTNFGQGAKSFLQNRFSPFSDLSQRGFSQGILSPSIVGSKQKPNDWDAKGNPIYNPNK